MNSQTIKKLLFIIFLSVRDDLRDMHNDLIEIQATHETGLKYLRRQYPYVKDVKLSDVVRTVNIFELSLYSFTLFNACQVLPFFKINHARCIFCMSLSFD